MLNSMIAEMKQPHFFVPNRFQMLLLCFHFFFSFIRTSLSFIPSLSRHQGELEKLNQSTDDINRWETELEVGQACLPAPCLVYRVIVPSRMVAAGIPEGETFLKNSPPPFTPFQDRPIESFSCVTDILWVCAEQAEEIIYLCVWKSGTVLSFV